ncbi:MAG: cytochrome c maturation protein CcmE [Bacteroidetes bacterium]|nr:cytochrome c maturation protein CcmE [Bacteroidota bacterium]MCH8523286.1 cytochrome c maturation protein CcmE [Balneolales bacterium]
MKPRLIFGIIFMVAFTSLVLYNFSGSIGTYVNFEEAAYRSGSSTYVIGTWVRDKPHGFNSQSRSFNFYMQDEAGNVRRVVYNNAKPQNFEDAIQLVVKGTMKNNIFYSDDMLVKCPSKYNDQSLEMTAAESAI